jgi:diaminohydroxyphosphoribosylaminopyrimidine deaminase/5-amino-6-(5-phosphoribosylamino)uracil reductase
LVATTPACPAEPRAAWEHAGAEVLVLEGPDASGRVPLHALVEALGKRDVQDALIEGGPTVAWAAFEEGVVDRIVLYLAPKLIGGRDAPGILGGEGIATIADALSVRIRGWEQVGDDIKVVGDVHRDR